LPLGPGGSRGAAAPVRRRPRAARMGARVTTVERTATTVTIGGAWTYEWAQRRRPFIHPLRTPAGHVLTRNAPDDHPWHHALWFAIKYVDGENFWEQAGGHGSLRVTAPPTVVETAA